MTNTHTFWGGKSNSRDFEITFLCYYYTGTNEGNTSKTPSLRCATKSSSAVLATPTSTTRCLGMKHSSSPNPSVSSSVHSFTTTPPQTPGTTFVGLKKSSQSFQVSSSLALEPSTTRVTTSDLMADSSSMKLATTITSQSTIASTATLVQTSGLTSSSLRKEVQATTTLKTVKIITTSSETNGGSSSNISPSSARASQATTSVLGPGDTVETSSNFNLFMDSCSTETRPN